MDKHEYPHNPVGDPALNYGEACIVARAILEARAIIKQQDSHSPTADTNLALHHIDQALALLNVEVNE